MHEEKLAGPEGVLVIPEKHCGTGVLTIGGSSGRIDADRARLLASHGALAMSIRWFGGDGQPRDARLVPLETFTTALNRLAPECDRLVISGVSFGAEAALSVASRDERVDGCIGFAPSPYVWSHLDPDGTQVSHWSYDGQALPSIPFDTTWRAETDPPAYAGMYRQSLQTADAETIAEATIPVERIRDLLVVAGGDDQVWPSVDFAQQVAALRSAHGHDTTLVALPDAGHRTLLPCEQVVTAGGNFRRGGTDETNRELGALAWPHVCDILRLP